MLRLLVLVLKHQFIFECLNISLVLKNPIWCFGDISVLLEGWKTGAGCPAKDGT